MTQTDIDTAADAPATGRRRQRGRRLAVVVLVLLGVVGLGTFLLLTSGPLAPEGHGGEEVADPSPEVVDDGLAAATTEIHAHLNWLIWGPSDARMHPDFPRLLDDTITAAQTEGRQEIAELLGAARDAAVDEDELLRAHDLAEDAEALAHGGELEGEGRVVEEPDADPAPGADEDGGS